MKVKRFQYSKPHTLIKEFFEIKADENESILTHFVPPLGYPEIVFYVGEHSQIKNTNAVNGIIKGQYTTLQKIDFKPDYHLFGIVLHPFGLKKLFNIDASQLTNSVIDVQEHPITCAILDEVQKFEWVNEQLIRQIEKMLSGFKLNSVSNETEEFIGLAEKSTDNRISHIIRDSSINIRTLQRRFKSEVGITPKEFLRIKRMNQVENKLSQGTEIFQIVSDFEFTDQSHLIKEFVQLRNHSPKSFLQNKLLLSDQLPVPEIVKLD